MREVAKDDPWALGNVPRVCSSPLRIVRVTPPQDNLPMQDEKGCPLEDSLAEIKIKRLRLPGGTRSLALRAAAFRP